MLFVLIKQANATVAAACNDQGDASTDTTADLDHVTEGIHPAAETVTEL